MKGVDPDNWRNCEKASGHQIYLRSGGQAPKGYQYDPRCRCRSRHGCVGATSPIKMAVASVRKGGTVTLVGNLSPTIDFPLQS